LRIAQASYPGPDDSGVRDRRQYEGCIGRFPATCLHLAQDEGFVGIGAWSFFVVSTRDIVEIIFVMGIGGDATSKGAMHYHERVLI
jgi:hypothetical protein